MIRKHTHALKYLSKKENYCVFLFEFEFSPLNKSHKPNPNSPTIIGKLINNSTVVLPIDQIISNPFKKNTTKASN